MNLSEYSIDDKKIFQQLAYCLHSDIWEYMNTHQAEYKRWRKKEAEKLKLQGGCKNAGAANK